MKIIISERQLKNVILREQVEETPPKTGEDCAAEGGGRTISKDQ